MKVDIEYKHGQSLYLKNDEEQKEYLLHRIILLPKGQIILEIFGNDEFFEVPEIFVTKEKDKSKVLGIEKGEDD